MLTLTLKLENLTPEAEKYIEKQLKYWEEITKKPRGYHFNEALTRYIRYLEWELEKRKLKEDKKRHPTPEELKIVWMRLNKMPSEYYFKEALVEYIEDMKDMEEYDKRKKEGKVKYYTSEELKKELKEYYKSEEYQQKRRDKELRK